MDSLTLPIFLYLIGVNLIEISGLIAYSTQEMSRGTFPWKIILGNILLIAYFNFLSLIILVLRILLFYHEYNRNFGSLSNSVDEEIYEGIKQLIVA